MYGYEQAIYSGMSGLGAMDPNVDWAFVAANWSVTPGPEFTEKFQDLDPEFGGMIRYATPAAAANARLNPERFLYLGPTFPTPWYKDPIILGAGAVVAGLVIFGIVKASK